MKFINLILFSFLFGMGVNSMAEIKSKIVEYKQGGKVLEGYLAYDSNTENLKKPGIIVVHDWMGVGPFVKEKADQLAQLGYVAFAADIYGKGVRPQNAKEAAEISGSFKKDRNLLRERVSAALDYLKTVKNVNTSQLAAMGYCFGGTAVLELGRAGADIKGIVSFHGGLDTPTPADAKNIKAKILALHGADDPFVPEDQVKAFEDEMRKAHIDWQLVKYANAVHSFTNPNAGNDNSKGAAYNQLADHRSWEAMKVFFKELFQ